MRIALIIIIAIHGVIHLIGFLKAFRISEFGALSQPVSKLSGSLWLMAAILFLISFVLLTIKNSYWWFFGILAVIISQILIIIFWKDAKFGTIPNIIILTVSIIAYANFNFINFVNSEVSQMYSKAELNQNSVVSGSMIAKLPVPVQNWLRKSGVNGYNIIQNVYLKQNVWMKMKPDQTNWYKARAEQYFNTEEPSFNWNVDLKMNPFVKVVGRDKFENGKGEMLIKLYSIFPVVNVKDNDKINQAALQRYLAEIVWFPTAALSRHITWDSIDAYSAKATMTFNGTTGSGIFYFNENWEFERFSAMRYKDTDENAQLKEWIAEVIESKVINGIKIPVEMKVTWKSKDAEWTWFKLKIYEIQYNTEEMPNVAYLNLFVQPENRK